MCTWLLASTQALTLLGSQLERCQFDLRVGDLDIIHTLFMEFSSEPQGQDARQRDAEKFEEELLENLLAHFETGAVASHGRGLLLPRLTARDLVYQRAAW